jgi:hypothetical protein
MKKYLLTIAAAALLPQVVSAQQAEVNPIPQLGKEWKYTVTPYLWLPNYSPTLTAGSKEIAPDGGNSQGKALGYVSGGFMLAGEAHQDRYGVMADFFNGSMKDAEHTLKGVTVGEKTKWDLTQTMFTVAGTYTLHQDKQAYVDALAGLRVLSVTGSLNSVADRYPSFTLNSVDPIVGLKGRVRIADSSWFVPFYGDIGGGGKASLTWQANVGVGKAFNWGDVSLGYRMMGYEMSKSINNDYLNSKLGGDAKAKMNMGALILTANFTF